MAPSWSHRATIPGMPTDDNGIRVRLPEHVREAIRRAADEQERSINRQVERYIKQGLVRDGLLPGWPDDRRPG